MFTVIIIIRTSFRRLLFRNVISYNIQLFNVLNLLLTRHQPSKKILFIIAFFLNKLRLGKIEKTELFSMIILRIKWFWTRKKTRDCDVRIFAHSDVTLKLLNWNHLNCVTFSLKRKRLLKTFAEICDNCLVIIKFLYKSNRDNQNKLRLVTDKWNR